MITDQALEDRVRIICERLNLTDAFTWVKEKNPSNNLPYHNWYHALCMVESVVEGANYHDLSYQSIRHLVVAALFHDFAHTGGKEKDAVNITRAVRGLWSLADRSTGRTVAKGIDMFEVEELIGVTEYPYVLDPMCIEQKVLRDADLMQSFRPTWKEMIVRGLREEISISLNRVLTETEMVEGQLKFLQNIKSNSKWGHDVMFAQNWVSRSIENFSSLV